MNNHIERERYLTECRDSAARMRIRNRQLTREERLYRKRRIVYFLCIALWAAVVAGILLWNEPAPEVAEMPLETIEVLPVESHGESPENKTEAVEMAFSPIRDDVPLDAEIQQLLYQACVETGIRYELALAVIWQETDFNCAHRPRQIHSC